MKVGPILARPITHGWLLGIVAGLAGGVGEVLWVSICSSTTPLALADIAREVTISVAPAFAQTRGVAAMGLIIHLALSAVLGLAYLYAVWPWANMRGRSAMVISALVVLTAVWTVNFFVVVPALNPAFVTLMPYSVTLTSKILFALSMTAVLINADRLRYCSVTARPSASIQTRSSG